MSDPVLVELTAEEAQLLWDGGCTILYKLPGTYIDQVWHSWRKNKYSVFGGGPASTTVSGCSWGVECE